MTSLDRILVDLAPLRPMFDDPDVTDVMINEGGGRIFAKRTCSAAELQPVTMDPNHLREAIRHIARDCGQPVTAATTILYLRLADGSRVNAIFPPVAVDGLTVTIRRFGHRLTLNDLMDNGTLSDRDGCQLARWVEDRRTILISGQTGAGKTTLLNALAALIPPNDRVVLVEDTSEMYLHKPNLVRLQARPFQRAGNAADPDLLAVTLSDLLRATRRQSPDRIILGEVLGPQDAVDLLDALTSGHAGSFSTIHADSPEDAITRLTWLVFQANLHIPQELVLHTIRSAVHVVVHLSFDDRRRRLAVLYELPREVQAVVTR